MAAVKSTKSGDKLHKGKWHKAIAILATAFFIIWIIIGILVLVIIFANFRQGAFQGLFAPAPQSQQVPTQVQAPTTTELPGVGMVNVACVQSSLSEEAIAKLVADEGTGSFTQEESDSIAPCIVDAETADDSN